ncbi:MAG: hypothetical protein L6455_14530 [Kiritimatiellae bacterium]|nr:hypothetical protein [Kiritimatiellia bacterium]
MKTKEKKLSDFRQQVVNANKHTPRGMGALEDSMQKVGYTAPIIAAADGEIISGSARHETAANVFGSDAHPIIIESDGKRPIVVVRKDIANASTKHAKQISLLENRVAELNLEWDTDVLADMLKDDPDILKGQFSEDELGDLMTDEGNPVSAEMPIVANLLERYDYVLIACDNETDFQFLKSMCGVRGEKSYKNKTVGEGRVVMFQRFMEKINESGHSVNGASKKSINKSPST